MANAVFYSNIAQQTTLSGSFSSTAVSITVDATTGFPTSYPYTLALDYGAVAEELVSVTNAAGTTLTVTRGYGGTSAQSHSLGAVVRHVYDATDATAFRTHEAATAAVHGVAGALVGTSDTQTLSNKTLSGGALSGTFTGAPTFSGNVTFSGVPSFSASALAQRASATDQAWRSAVTGDANDRFYSEAGGKLHWGPGNTTPDTALYRSAVGELTTDGVLVVSGESHLNNLVRNTRTNTTDSAYETRASGQNFAPWYVRADGQMNWGSGVGPTDTTLYRSAAGVLKTDGKFQASNFPPVTSSWTPVWSTSSGLHPPSLGNATVTGRYVEIGVMVHFTLRIVFGSTTSFGGGTSTDNWLFSLPVTAARGDDPCGWYAARPANSNASMGNLSVVSADTTNMQLNIDSGQPNGSAVANAGLVDSVSPFTWAAGDALVMCGFYEAVN